MVVEGLRRTYPDLAQIIDDTVAEPGQDILRRLQNRTTVHATLALMMHDLDRYTRVPLADIMARPELVQIFQDIQPGKSAPTFPLMINQASYDWIIACDDVDGQVQRYRKAGAHVRYDRDRLADHISLHPLTASVVMEWLADRFAGRPLDEPSTTTRWSTALTPRGLRGLLGLGVSTGLAALGR